MDWQLPDDNLQPSAALRSAVGGHPLVAQVLARRGWTDPRAALAFLDPAHYSPAPPDDLPDLCAAAERLLAAVRGGERILVWGDFDVDGQTATALLVGALRGLGAEPVYHIPRRVEHGHGVQAEVLGAYLAGGVEVVLTCDTGISEHEAAGAARRAGASMLITDHHALPERLPAADAVVNPQRLPAGHPLRDLPGVGVAYKLVEKLYALAGRAGEEAQFLDLVALGIVADVATQRGDTRYLLQRGLDALRFPGRPGLQALMTAAQVDPTYLSTETIGFQLGPRLNALGRLDDAGLAVELLTTSERALARQIAQQLEVLNAQRKQLQDQITMAALRQVEANPSWLEFEALVVLGDGWHPGLLGIVAGRLAELYNRPAVVLAQKAGEPAKGSARSVPGVDIGAAIAACADLLLAHGGHPGAAGCTLPPGNVAPFRQRLSAAVAEAHTGGAPAAPRVDAMLPLSELSMGLAEDLDRLAPFGEGNPPVQVMVPRLTVRSSTTFGLERQHRRVTVEDAAGESAVITWWRGAESPLPPGLFDLLLTPRASDYRGRRTLQLEWAASRPTPGAPVEVRPSREVVDLRAELDPLAKLPADGFLVWAEALEPGELPFDADQVATRLEIRAAPALVIWTAPPGPHELRELIESSGAHTFYLVGQHHPEGSVEGFVRRLAALAKYAVHAYPDGVALSRLAASTGQREVAVRAGLDWLAARGKLGVEWLEDEVVRIRLEGTADPAAARRRRDALEALLAEASAFRAYFRRRDLSSFFEG